MKSALKCSVVALLGSSLFLLWRPQLAIAQQHKRPATKSINCQPTGATLTVVGAGGTCVIGVHQWSQFEVPRGAEVGYEQSTSFEINYVKAEGLVNVGVKTGAPEGAQVTIKALMSSHTVTIIVFVAPEQQVTYHRWKLRHETEAEVAAKKAAHAAEREASKQRSRAMALDADNKRLQGKLKMCRRDNADLRGDLKESEDLRIKAEDKATQDAKTAKNRERERALRTQLENSGKDLLADGPEASEILIPHPNDRATFAHRVLDIDFGRARWEGDYLLFHTKLGTSTRPYQLAEALVRTKDGRALETRIVTPRVPADNLHSIIARISPIRQRDVIIGVKLADEESDEGMTLELTEPDGKHLRTAQIPRYRDNRILEPVTEAQERAERLEKERQQRARQTIIGVSGNVGAFWIADGLGADKLEATSFQGLGVRLVKGFNSNWAVEVEVEGAKTGTARFENMTINEMQGDLTRSASFFRAGFGGLLRFGDKVTPYLRLGVAGQVASFDAGFSEAVDMDESSYEFSALVTFGGGVQVRLGGNWVLGAALSAETPLGVSDGKLFGNAVSFGGHIAYGW